MQPPLPYCFTKQFVSADSKSDGKLTMDLTIVYFVRHGETAANLTNTVQGQLDYPLDDAGLRQADAVAERLKDMKFDVIYSSDLSRAAATAEKISGGRKVIKDPALREWMLGEWQTRTIQDIKKLYPEEYRKFTNDDPDFVPSGGESSAGFRRRAADFLKKVHAECSGRTVLCVSHGGFIKQILKCVMGVETFGITPKCENTSVSAFATSDGVRWQLLFWNDHSHLEHFTSSSGW